MLTLLLIYSFLFGMSAGVFNDISRIIRAFWGVRYSKKSFERLYELKLPLVGRLGSGRAEGKWNKRFLGVIIFFQDILLFGYFACGVVVLNYYLNRGQLRLYTVAVAAAGFAVYYFTLGRLLMLLSEGVIFFIRAALNILLHIIFRPFVLLFRLIFKIFGRVSKKLRSAIEKKASLRYNKEKQRELTQLSLQGFLK